VAEQPAQHWRTTLKRRLAVAAGAFLLWSAAIEARLVYFQVVQHDFLVAAAERQQSQTIIAPAKRGEILDRDGHLLAFSVDAATLYAVPTEIADATRTVAALCRAFGDCDAKERASLLEKFSPDPRT
jgi:penicillin-binding protein 2